MSLTSLRPLFRSLHKKELKIVIIAYYLPMLSLFKTHTVQMHEDSKIMLSLPIIYLLQSLCYKLHVPLNKRLTSITIIKAYFYLAYSRGKKDIYPYNISTMKMGSL